MPPESSAPVTLRSKIIYGIGAGNDMWGNWFYVSVVWLVFNQNLGVSGSVISTALAARLLWDAITDPVFGWWSDNTRTRFGRRRPFILVGSICMGLTFPLLFWVGPEWSETQYKWYMIGTSVLFITFVSCFNMPYQSLGAEMSPDYDERNSLFKVKGAVQKILELATFAAGAFATALVWDGATWADVPGHLVTLIGDAFLWTLSMIGNLFTLDFSAALDQFKVGQGPASGKVNVLFGIKVYTVILGVGMMVIGLLLFTGLKERYFDNVVSKKQDKVRITESLWKALQCKPFRYQLLMMLSYALGLSMVGTLGYYTTIYYVAGGNQTEGNLWNLVMGLSMTFFGVCGPLVFGFVARFLDKRTVLLIIQICSVGAFVGSWWLYDPARPWLQVFASGSIAFTQAAFWMMFSSLGAEVIDFDEYETGTRREGVFSACSSYMMKIGLVIAMFITGRILDRSGFDAALGGDQSPEALFWIRFIFAAVPVVGILISIYAILMFPLSKRKMKDIRAALEARRGTV